MADDEENYECGAFKPTKCARYSLFGVCLFIGVILVVTSFIDAIGQGKGGAAAMVICGNILVILSTLFLYGPKKLLESVKAADRIIISIAYLVVIVLSVLAVLIDWGSFFKFIILGAECVLMILYVLSYFPKIRDCIVNCFKNCCCKKDGGASSPMV